jgi:CRP/FNR family transcriptional regulator
VFAGESYSAGAEAREATRATFFSRRLFSDLIHRSPAAAAVFIEELARELRRTRERLLERRDQDASARLARCLVDLQGQKQGPLAVARLELADMIGTAPETISRLLRHFSDHGFIARRGRKIQLSDRAQLAALAGSDQDGEVARV